VFDQKDIHQKITHKTIVWLQIIWDNALVLWTTSIKHINVCLCTYIYRLGLDQ